MPSSFQEAKITVSLELIRAAQEQELRVHFPCAPETTALDKTVTR